MKMQGEFIWHNHEEPDEAFIVIEGDLSIAFRDGRGQVNLTKGEMFVVPRRVEHKPIAKMKLKFCLLSLAEF